MQKKSFLIDINGVLYTGKKPIPGAVETIEFLRDNNYSFRFVTNATRSSRQTIYNRLSSMGFDIKLEEIFSAPYAAINFIKKKNKNRIFLLTTGDVQKDFISSGIILTENKPDYVVVGDAGDNFTFTNMNKAFNLLLDGAELIALEKDKHWITDNERLLCAGPYVDALEYATGKKAKIMGKPSKEFFNLALKDMDASAKNTTLIGDDIHTDILGAQKAGMKTCLVLSGKTTKESMKKTKIKPDKTLKSIAEIKSIYY